MTMVYRFRRITVFAVIAALLLGACSVMAVAMPGDLSGDGRADTADVRLMLLSFVEERDFTEEQRLVADRNGDGEVDSTDARLMLMVLLQPTTTSPTALTSTMPPVETTNTTTTTTFYPTTTTTWVLTGPDGTAPTTTYTTTVNQTTTVRTTVTTMPYEAFSVSVDSQVVRAGDTFVLPIRITEDHALVGFEMDVYYDPSMLALTAVNDDLTNPYATELHVAVFDSNAAWRFTKLDDGILNVRYVSSAEAGSREAGVLFALTFLLDDDVDGSTDVYVSIPSRLCCDGDTHTMPFVMTPPGTITVRSRTTRPSTTVPTTADTTYPPTTATTWVLTGPDGTAPTTTTTFFGFTTTTTTVPDCVSTPATTIPTTLPYGDPLYFTGETVTARVGNTFTWTVSVSDRHSLVGLRMEIYFDAAALEWIPDGTVFHEDIFNDEAQWRLAQIDEGMLALQYVSTADTGAYNGGELVTLTFRLREDLDVSVDETYIYIDAYSCLSAVGGFAYDPQRGGVEDGRVIVASRTTLPKTTTTITTTVNTDPPITTTLWNGQ